MRNEGEDSLAPVIPLFGADAAGRARPAASAPQTWHTTWTEPVDADAPGGDASDDSADERTEAGEAALLRKLRTRSLSVREARAVLVERELDEASVDSILDRFMRDGYLDDAKLAEQLVYSAVDRKGQGRMAVAQTLAKRGVPRDVIDAALAELPDDEFERALEFARGKARSMRDLERDVALRRLSGQLARRGYGAQSLTAARQALDEAARPARSGVRFEP